MRKRSRPEEFEVRGIFDVGYYEYNANVMITSLANAQDLYNLNDSVHGLMVMLKDPYKAAAGPGGTVPPAWVPHFPFRSGRKRTPGFSMR